MCLLWGVGGKGYPCVPSRSTPLGRNEKRVGSVVYEVSLRRDAWVRVLVCTVILVRFVVGPCGREALRVRFVARWGSPSVLFSYCLAVHVL